MDKKLGKTFVIAIISAIVFVGNIFSATWTWGNNPRSVSIILTIVAVLSIFAWIVAIALFTEPIPRR